MRHLDADDFYWLPTDPPYAQKRDPQERGSLLRAELFRQADVVLSGSIVGWSSDVEEAFDLVVFLWLPAPIRVERLERRERMRFGVADPKFLEWARQYDEGPAEGRSLAKHNAWLNARRCPVLRLEDDASVSVRAARVLEALSRLRAAGTG
jgi:hypothetical protein